MSPAHRSLAEIEGPWKEPNFESGLIERLHAAWSKPVESLTNHELATCLRQRIAVDHLLLLAKRRIEDGFDDDTEIYDAELARTIKETEYWCRTDDDDRRIRGLPPREKKA